MQIQTVNFARYGHWNFCAGQGHQTLLTPAQVWADGTRGAV